MEHRRNLALHIHQCAQNSTSHVIDLLCREPHAASHIVTEIVTVQQLHKSIEQAVLCPSVVCELHDIVVRQVLQRLKLIDGFRGRHIPVEYFHRVELVLQSMLRLEHAAESPMTKLLIKDKLRSNRITRLEVSQIDLSLGMVVNHCHTAVRCCRAYDSLLDSSCHLVDVIPSAVHISHNGMLHNLVQPLRKVTVDM